MPMLRGRRFLVAPLVLALLGGLLAACTAEASPDPSAPCNGADSQQYEGFYPDLERLIPHTLPGATSNGLSSGRFCSAKTLGSLYDKGIRELHFGASSWSYGTSKNHGVALVVYRATGLTLDLLADSFATGAGQTQGAAGIAANRATISGRQGVKITAVIDSLPEAVFVWPAAAPDTMYTVTAVGATDAELSGAVAAFDHPGS